MRKTALLFSVLLLGTVFYVNPASANFLDDLKKLVKPQGHSETAPQERGEVQFKVFLTNGQVLSCLDAKSPYTSGAVRVLTDFESTTKIQLRYVKYIDFVNTSENILENEYSNASVDIIHLVNSDIISGSILGFGSDSCKIATPYGTHDILLKGVDYIILSGEPSTVKDPTTERSKKLPY